MFHRSVVINAALPKEGKPGLHNNYTLMQLFIRPQLAGFLETVVFIAFLCMPKPLWPSGTHMEPLYTMGKTAGQGIVEGSVSI